MSEDSESQFEQIGIIQLIKNMLSPRTLPHIIMIALISSICGYGVHIFGNIIYNCRIFVE